MIIITHGNHDHDHGARPGLMYAASGSHDDIVELLLLQPGVDINSPDSSVLAGGTCSAAHYASTLGQLFIYQHLAALYVSTQHFQNDPQSHFTRRHPAPLGLLAVRKQSRSGHRNMNKMMFNMILSFDLNSVTVDIMMTHIFVIWSMSLSNQR